MSSGSARRALLALVACVIGAALVSCSNTNRPPATLVVRADGVLRPVTHVASGGLYGLATAAMPDPGLLLPLRVNQLTQPPPGVQQLGNGATVPTGDALKVAPTAISTGAQIYVRMPDIYPDFPYKWVSWADWLSKVDSMVVARLAATTTTSINGWELWNEPDWTWDTVNAGDFDQGWVRTYRAVRAKDAVTPIVGPSFSTYSDVEMAEFLANAKATNTVPDVVSWHELAGGAKGWSNIGPDVADYRALEKSFGISPRPISINEYAAKDEIDTPSGELHYIAALERAGVATAGRAYWYESGTIGGLLYKSLPTASYWLYKWYGDMSGNMLTVTGAGTLDGFASYDVDRRALSVVFGGPSGDSAVEITGVHGLGSSVDVRLSSTPSSGRHTPVAKPTLLSTTTMTVDAGSLVISVPSEKASSAYQIEIVPHGASMDATQHVYEAENATIVNGERESSTSASNGGYVSGLDGSDDARSDSFVDFTVDVPEAGAYSLSVRYRNGGAALASQGLQVNRGTWSTMTFPPSTGNASARRTARIELRRGYNVIRLAKGSPDFAGGAGVVDLDAIIVTRSL